MTVQPHSKQASTAAIWAAMISVYIVWGSTYLAIRYAVATMPPFLMAGVRFLVAGLFLYGFRRLRGDSASTRFEWRSAAIVGLFLLMGGNGGVVWAEQRVVSGVAALLVGSSPLWMVLIDALRPGGKRPGWQTVAGVLVGFAGIALLIGPAQFGGGGQAFDPWGIAALLVGGFLWAVGSLAGRDLKLPASPLLGTGMEMLAGGAGLVLLGTLSGEWGRLHLASISVPSLLGLAYLILFGSLVGFASYTWLLKVAPIALVSTYAYVNPLIAVFIGNLFLKEPLTPRILLATLIIISAVALINTSRSASTRAKPKAAVLPSSGDD